MTLALLPTANLFSKKKKWLRFPKIISKRYEILFVCYFVKRYEKILFKNIF